MDVLGFGFPTTAFGLLSSSFSPAVSAEAHTSMSARTGFGIQATAGLLTLVIQFANPGFIEFINEKQFTFDAHELAAKSAFRVRELRSELHSLRAIARRLNETVRPHWGRYHAAIASSLVGDVSTALEHVETLYGLDTELHALASSLTQLLAEPQAFRLAVARIIRESRRLHKLPEAQNLMALLDAGEN